MAAGAIKAGRAYVELAMKNNISKGLGRAQASLNKFGDSLGAMGRQLMMVGGAVLAGFGAATAIFASMGDQLNKMAIRTGVSVEALSALGFAAQRSGASLETLENGLKRMQRNIVDAGRGLSTAVDSLDMLGLSAKELDGLAPEEQFKLIAQRISQIEDPTKRAAIAQMLFGRAGADLLPLMMQGAAGIDALIKKAEEMGIVMSTEDAAAAATLTDAMGDVKDTLKAVAVQIGASLAPILTDMADRMSAAVSRLIAWAKINRHLIVLVAKVATGIVVAGAALVAFGIAVKVAAFAIGVLNAVLGVLGAILAFITSPIGIVIALVGAAAFAFYKFTDSGKAMANEARAYFGDLAGTAKTTFDGVKDSLLAGDWKLAAKIAWIGIKSSWTSGIRPLKEAWIGFKFSFLNIAGQMWDGIRKGWGRLSGFIQKTWLKMKGWFTDTDTSGQQAAVDQATAASEKKMDSERRKAIAANNAEAGAALQAIDKEEKQARAELAAIRQQAAEKRQAAEAAAAGPPVDELDFEADAIEMPAMEDFKAKLKQTAGALSSAAAMRMGRDVTANMGGGVEEKNADANVRAAKGIEQIVKLIDEGAAVFA